MRDLSPSLAEAPAALNIPPTIATTPLPIRPIPVARLWGGAPPPDVPAIAAIARTGAAVGELWKLASIGEVDSIIAAGPLAGIGLRDVVDAHREAVLGAAQPVDGRFPLLIKLLNAARPISAQAHPCPRQDRSPDGAVKHEAWVIVHAEPGAEVLIGLKPGVTRDDLATAIGTHRVCDLMRVHPARAGDCYYLPSGVPHAVGAGVVIYEAQTPSDVTYRMYDWDRVDASGNPRELHAAAALANVRFDCGDGVFRQTPRVVNDIEVSLCRGDAFSVSRLTFPAGERRHELPTPFPRVWTVITGVATLESDGSRPGYEARPGDTILLPAALDAVTLRVTSDLTVLQTIPR
ncbi:MAG: hypothetical protein KDA32_14635 [Phycisphaerales bacterium]|nr:hypothetical protein [Phycisphaerales bacterium]